MKAIALARVSTEEQKEAGNSLPAQIERLKAYCARKGFEIVKTFSFDESAYKTKRDEFDKILEYLNAQKEKVAVCFDKVDRFSRNVFDKRVSVLYELAMKDTIELHFASDNLVVTSNISATEKFHLGINLNLAKYYSDAISDNVKRAYEQKLRKGEWIGKAPIGYLNIKDEQGNKDIVLDSIKAPLIKRLFELYATGGYSIRTLTDEMAKIGLKSETGKPIVMSMVNHILNNRFYYGDAVSKGRIYPHKYERLIDKDLYIKCQAIKMGWSKKPFQYAAKPFIFRGLLTCAKCGSTMSPETKKGRFTYYSCTNYRKNCKRIYIPESKLLEPIYKVLTALKKIPQERIDEIVGELKKASENKNFYHLRVIQGFQKEYNELQAKIGRLVDLFAENSITKDIYDQKLKVWKDRQLELSLLLEEHTKADENFYIAAGHILNLAKNAFDIFESSEVPEKRALLNYLLQNPKVNGKKLEFTLRNPFDRVLICTKSSNCEVYPI